MKLPDKQLREKLHKILVSWQGTYTREMLDEIMESVTTAQQQLLTELLEHKMTIGEAATTAPDGETVVRATEAVPVSVIQQYLKDLGGDDA